MIKITVTERPQTVRVEHDGRTHTARWRDGEVLSRVQGDEGLLRAALTAWSGQEGEWEISPSDLGEQGGGWWAP